MDNKTTGDAVQADGWCVLPHGYGSFNSKAAARLMALVLDSRSIPCCIEAGGGGWLLLVQESRQESALRELRLYEAANSNWPPPLPAERNLAGEVLPTLCVLILLATFHNLSLIGSSLPGPGFVDLKELGMARAGEIVHGAWWQCVTALTLHADLSHLLSNLAIGGFFVMLLCRELGSGLAWSLLLSAGALGNLLNALVQSPAHRSVGASTAVFGTVGILAAISAVRYRHHFQRRWFVPFAAGIALLALLGTEGKQTDLGAHLFGFGSGIMLGISVEYMVMKYGRPGKILNVILSIASGAVVIAAWAEAIG